MLRTRSAGVLGAAALLCSSVLPVNAIVAVRPDGRPIEVLSRVNGHAKAVVLFFVATDCPISDRTFPEMRRVREQFSGRGVQFWFVYPNRGEDGTDVGRHQGAFDSGGEALLDPLGKLVKLTRARVTPEAAVLVQRAGEWTPVYTGRIDNRYVHIGLERPQATEHDVQRALEQVLAGVQVLPSATQPVGCGIVSPDR